MSQSLTARAKALAERCMDAYSSDNYQSWTAVAKMLLQRGWSESQAEEIMRSKYTRWAGDRSGKPYGRNTANDLASYLDTCGDDHLGRMLAEIGLPSKPAGKQKRLTTLLSPDGVPIIGVYEFKPVTFRVVGWKKDKDGEYEAVYYEEAPELHLDETYDESGEHIRVRDANGGVHYLDECTEAPSTEESTNG